MNCEEINTKDTLNDAFLCTKCEFPIYNVWIDKRTNRKNFVTTGGVSNINRHEKRPFCWFDCMSRCKAQGKHCEYSHCKNMNCIKSCFSTIPDSSNNFTVL